MKEKELRENVKDPERARDCVCKRERCERKSVRQRRESACV